MQSANRIENTLPLDIGTVDIIQSEPQFKKKNTLQYRGILSDMTSEEKTGFLSTTGKRVVVRGSYVDIYNGQSVEQTFDMSSTNNFKITYKGKIDVSNVLAACTNDYRVFFVQKTSTGLAVKSANNQGKNITTLREFSGYKYAGVVGNGQGFALVGDVSANVNTPVSLVLFSNGSSSIIQTISFSVNNGSFGLGSNISAYWPGSGECYWVGFDDVDMRKRKVVAVNTSGSIVATVNGFGCIGENGLITGEPIIQPLVCPWGTTNKQHPVNVDVGSAASANSRLRVYEQTARNSFSWAFGNGVNTYTGGLGYQQVESNGIIYTARINPLSDFVYTTHTARNSGTSTDQDTVTWTTSNSGSVKNYAQKLGANPTTWKSGTQSGKDNWKAALSLMDVAVGNTQANGDDYEQVNYVLVYALQTTSSGTFYPKAVIVQGRWRPGCAYRTDGGATDYWNGGWYTGTMDWTDPLGKVGEASQNSIDSRPFYPAIGWISNKAANRGITYDYGKGWVKFYLDKFYFTNLRNFGMQVLENPLLLYTYGLDCESGNYNARQLITSCVDNVRSLEVLDGMPSLGFGTNNENYPAYDDSSITNYITETGWCESLTSSQVSWLDVLQYKSGNNVMRLHMLTENQITVGLPICNHSYGSQEVPLLTAIPWSHNIVNFNNNGTTRLMKHYFDGKAVAISAANTLLNTPFTMGEYNYWIRWPIGAVVWDDTGITFGFISTGELKISKIADFIFTVNTIGATNGNVLVENRNGEFELKRAFIPYIMDSHFKEKQYNYINARMNYDYAMPQDGTSISQNDTFLYGFGFNPNLNNKEIASSFLLPAVTIPCYVATADVAVYNKEVLEDRNSPFIANVDRNVPNGILIDEFYTHSQATTDVIYKNSRDNSNVSTFDDDKANTSWWVTGETVIFPVGVLSQTFGENYITSTVALGENYTSRFYSRNNKTFLVFNNSDQVYFGSEIFTIQSGNYYFDGQGIYYLGSQSDYSQNIFTAYAIGMEFLANSSSEAYFYSKWDKCLYLYTASNTLQKSISLADRGNILDALYSSAEQSLYILFDDGSVYIRTQIDDCLIGNVSSVYTKLQSTDVGAFLTNEAQSQYLIFNPYLYEDFKPLEIETEWLGTAEKVSKFSYIDVVFYSKDDNPVDAIIEMNVLNGDEVESTPRTISIKKSDWKNHLYRERIVPKHPVGNATKLIVHNNGKNQIGIHSMAMVIQPASETPSAARKARV